MRTRLHKDALDMIPWPMVVGVIGLMIIGPAFIYSATHAAIYFHGIDPIENSGLALSVKQFLTQDHIKQLIGYGVGLVAAIVVCVIDYKTLARWAYVAYALSLLLLFLVLIEGIGREIYGARRWIVIGSIRMQPSELAKLAFILALANFLSRPRNELQSAKVFWQSLGLAALPCVLIVVEPDLGSSLLFLPVALVMMYYAGISKAYLIRLVTGGTIFVILTVINILFAPVSWRLPIEDYQRQRLLVYFDRDFTADLPDGTPGEEVARLARLQKDRTLNIRQALISVGSGGISGKGWLQGPQNALGWLPKGVAHNDFIFSVIAEESGFIGSTAVLVFYSMILFSGIKIAGHARDQLGQLIAVGVVILLFIHVFINIGMNIGIVPVTGIPLPLLSAGGTSAVCSLIAIGLLLNVHLNQRNY